MSLSGTSKSVAGDEDLDLHRLFDFFRASEATAADLSPLAKDVLAAPRLASQLTEPLEDFQCQPAGWLSSSAAGPVDCLDTFDFNNFLSLDGSTNDLPGTTEASAPPPPSSPVLTDTNTPQQERAATSELAGDIPAATSLEAAQAEILQLKAALAAEGLQPELLTTPRDRQSSSSPRKRGLSDSETSPPKKQTTTQVGPIEALWFRNVTEDECRAVHTNLTSPTTPKQSLPQLNFTAQPSTPYTSSLDDCAISPEDLHSIQAFLQENTALVHSTSHHVETSLSDSGNTMAHPVNMKAKQMPINHAPRRASKTTNTTTTKVTKKPKATPKRKQRQRTTSTSSSITSSPTTSTSHRSIDELLAANFYSLSAQEKVRIVLPMLRNLDPRELERSLAELPCIQAKGAGHEIRVARAIHNSPPTPEDDDILATRLTTGTPPSPTPTAECSNTSSAAPAVQTLPLLHKVVHVKVSGNQAAIRQREALEKATILQAQGKKR